MSNPENILARYRTYSYHHILIACDNNAAANYISDAKELSVFREIGDDTIDASGVFTPAIEVDAKEPVCDATERTRIGNYVVILNSLIDTRYVIQNAQWMTATAASTDQQDRFNSLAVEGSIEVQEPGGIRFMNALNAAADKLKTDPTGIIWLLKTIFVGHGVNDDGSEFTDHITNLTPLQFMIYDVTGTFSTSGGTYSIEFAGIANGASRFPQFSRASEQITFTPDENTLKSALTGLATRMSDQSTDNRDCLVKALNVAYADHGVNLETLRGVKFEIILEDPYDTDAYVITGWDCRQTDLGLLNARGAFKFGKSCTVEQSIRHIMERCERVLKDRTEGDTDGVKYTYKIHSSISMVGADASTQTGDGQTVTSYDNVVVKYVIQQFANVTNQTVSTLLGLDPNLTGRVDFDNLSPDNREKLEQNLIEFDYFFTGKNIDIINFDIKMEMGLMFLQTLATSNTLPTQAEQVMGSGIPNKLVACSQENAHGEPEGTESPPRITIRNRTPIFPSTKVKDILLKNAGNPKDTALFQAYMARQAALESIEANITITGNPYLMSQTNRSSGDTSNRDRVGGGEEARIENVLLNWDTQPGLCRLNIFMPAGNDIPSSNSNFELEQFWYQGFYYLYAVTHKFNEGIFTQELQLLSLINQSAMENNSDQELDGCGIQPDPPPATTEQGENGQPDPNAPVTGAGAVAGTGATNETELEACDAPTGTEG